MRTTPAAVAGWTTLMLAGVAVVRLAAASPPFRIEPGSRLTIDYGGRPRLAVQELQTYVSRMLPRGPAWTVRENTAAGDSCWIRVGKGTAAGRPTGVPPNPDVDEYSIAADPASVTLAASNPATLLGSVYSLLEEAGCRWLYPGPEGEIVPHKDAVEFTGGRRGSRAGFGMRGLFPVENLQRYTERDVRDTLDWMSRNRMNHLVVLYNYGWRRLGRLVAEESRKRDIKLVGYLWSFELFLPLELGKQHPEYFAWIDGQRRVDYNVKRCASSPAAIKLYVENAMKFFQANPEIDTWNVIPNDGYHWCGCDGCRRMKPKDQWAAFFVPLVERVMREAPRVRLQNFIYVHRYDLPVNLEPYRAPRLDHFFDVHQRNKWFTLREPGPSAGRHGEAAVDERARALPLNNYLADRMKAWREAVGGRMWVFENLMLHSTYSIPVPNLPVLAADLEAARREKLQGYFFEAYLQGWNSFASDLWALARLCWNPSLDPAALEAEYFGALLGGEAGPMKRFHQEFRTLHWEAVRRCGGLYWMHCVPEAGRDYASAVRSLKLERMPAAGLRWASAQVRVAEVMEEILRRRAGVGTGGVLGTERSDDVLAVCRAALRTGRAMDGVFFAYEQLRQHFLRRFPKDPLGFRPLLPPHFDAEVRSLFERQKLWDTLAEWEREGRFPRDPQDPESDLRRILEQAMHAAAGGVGAPVPALPPAHHGALDSRVSWLWLAQTM